MKTIVILAGGKSSRMGADKTFATYKGKTFLEILLDKAWKCFDRVIIAAGSKEHSLKVYEYLKNAGVMCTNRQPEILADRYDSIGPMGGILSVFEQTKLEQFALTAVDLPMASMKVLEHLLDLLEGTVSPPKSAVMLSVNDDHTEACAAAYDRSSCSYMKQAQEKGCNGLFRALGEEAIKIVSSEELKNLYPDCSDVDFGRAFRNINTAEELKDLND